MNSLLRLLLVIAISTSLTGCDRLNVKERVEAAINNNNTYASRKTAMSKYVYEGIKDQLNHVDGDFKYLDIPRIAAAPIIDDWRRNQLLLYVHWIQSRYDVTKVEILFVDPRALFVLNIDEEDKKSNLEAYKASVVFYAGFEIKAGSNLYARFQRKPKNVYVALITAKGVKSAMRTIEYFRDIHDSNSE